MRQIPRLSAFSAVLFDLDGVITDTASVHANAWKRMFDSFLQERDGDAFLPFEIATDYASYVDGKPRYEGVASFLASRGIALPEGSDDDPPEATTVKGLGNRKNAHVLQAIAEGVTIYDTSVAVVDALREAGVTCAVVSSSRNATTVLQVTGLIDKFAYVLDGTVAAADSIAGKPRPDTYLAAADRVGATAATSVVIEDAVSGVQAGRAGEFGLVVGVDRLDQADDLAAAGADVVVSDLAELEI